MIIPLAFGVANALILVSAVAVRKYRSRASFSGCKPSPPTRTSFKISNQLADLAKVADRTREFGEMHNLPLRIVFDLELLVEEMFSYVIHNGKKKPGSDELTIRLGKSGGEVSVCLIDHGVALNPLNAPAIDLTRPLEDIPLEGWDIFVLRRYADRIEYRTLDGSNFFTATKTIPASPPREVTRPTS